MAQLTVEWKVIGVQDVLAAQKAVAAKDAETTAAAIANIEKRKQALAGLEKERVKLAVDGTKAVEKELEKERKAFEKAEKDKTKVAEKEISERVKAVEKELKDAEKKRQAALREFETNEQKRTKIAQREAAARWDYENKRAKDSTDVHNAVIRGLGLSGYYGPGRPVQMLEGIVGGIKGAITGAIKMGVGALAAGATAGIGIGVEEFGTNSEWSNQLAHNQRVGAGGKAVPRQMISAWLRDTASQSGVSESAIGQMMNAYSEGGGTLSKSSMDYLAKLQMVLPHSNIAAIAGTAGQLSTRLGESGMQRIIATAYAGGNMEKTLPKAQALWQMAQNAGIQSQDVVGMTDILRMTKASAGKFKEDEGAGEAFQAMLSYANKSGIRGKTIGETLSNVDTRMQKVVTQDKKGQLHINDQNLSAEDFQKFSTLVESTRSVRDQFGKLDDSMSKLSDDAKELDDDPLVQLKKTYNEISATIGAMMPGPAKEFSEWLKSNKDNIAAFMGALTKNIEWLLDVIGNLDFTPLIDVLKSLGLYDEGSVARTKSQRAWSQSQQLLEQADQVENDMSIPAKERWKKAKAMRTRAEALKEQGASYNDLANAADDETRHKNSWEYRLRSYNGRQRADELERVKQAAEGAAKWSDANVKGVTESTQKAIQQVEDKHTKDMAGTLKEIHRTLQQQRVLGPTLSREEQPK